MPIFTESFNLIKTVLKYASTLERNNIILEISVGCFWHLIHIQSVLAELSIVYLWKPNLYFVISYGIFKVMYWFYARTHIRNKTKLKTLQPTNLVSQAPAGYMTCNVFLRLALVKVSLRTDLVSLPGHALYLGLICRSRSRLHCYLGNWTRATCLSKHLKIP